MTLVRTFAVWIAGAALLATPLTAVASDRAAICDRAPVFAELGSNPELLTLGRDLFYDPILSGNRNVACATCHHPTLGTSDGLALGIGDGGSGLGPNRSVNPGNLPAQRIPRNAPALFNLGYPEFSVMFHDGRVERLANGRIRTPLGGMDAFGPLPVLSAQAMFPVTSPDEMAGHGDENDISRAVQRGFLTGPDGVHGLLAKRVAAISSYRERFAAIAPDQPLDYRQIATALAAFTAHEWRADESPFDAYLCDGKPLPGRAEQGRALFYGKAECATCHAGRFQTDHRFHAIAMPQIGPGKAARFEDHARDTGRMRVTGNAGDAYRFRTPSLRNVALTAPYGHAGAFATLEQVVRHHANPVASLDAYASSDAHLPALDGVDDFRVLNDAAEMAAIRGANRLAPVALTDDEIGALVAFLNALTDLSGVNGRLGVPGSVPSGLPVPIPDE